jgi:hypothetical protein
LEQSPSLEGPDRPGALADHLRDLLGVQAADDAQEEHVPLVRRQPFDERPDLGGPQVVQRLGLGVAGRSRNFQVLKWLRRLAAPSTGTPIVEEAVVGDRERERPELCLASLEALEIAEQPEEHLPDQVIGIGCSPGSDVRPDAWGKVAMEDPPGPFSAQSSGSKHLRKGLAYRHESNPAIAMLSGTSAIRGLALKLRQRRTSAQGTP